MSDFPITTRLREIESELRTLARTRRHKDGKEVSALIEDLAEKMRGVIGDLDQPQAGTDAYEMVAAVEQRNVEITDTLINMVAATVLAVLIDEEGGGRSNITFSPKAMDDMHSRYEMSAKRDGLLTTVSIKPRPEAFPPLKMENADGFGEAEPQAAAHEFDLPVWAIRYYGRDEQPYLAKMLDRADAQRHLPDYVGPFDVPEPTIENRCCLHVDCPNTHCNHVPDQDDAPEATSDS